MTRCECCTGGHGDCAIGQRSGKGHCAAVDVGTAAIAVCRGKKQHAGASEVQCAGGCAIVDGAIDLVGFAAVDHNGASGAAEGEVAAFGNVGGGFERCAV